MRSSPSSPHDRAPSASTPRPARSPSGSGVRDHVRAGQRAGARPAVRDRHAWRGTPRTPPRPPAGPAASRRTAEFRSEERQSHLADGEGQLYSRSSRNAPSGGSGRRRANPVTPLKSPSSPTFPHSSTRLLKPPCAPTVKASKLYRRVQSARLKSPGRKWVD